MDTVFTLYFSTYHNESRTYKGTTRNVRSFIDARMQELGLDGATLAQPEGVWCGEWEHSYTLTVVGTESTGTALRSLATDLAAHYEQDAIMMTSTPATVEFI